MFQVSSLDAANTQIEHSTGGAYLPGNTSSFAKHYVSGSVFRPYIRRYEIRENNGRRALYLIDGAAAAVELVEDVVDMRIQVGEKASPTASVTWSDASAATIDFANVVAMRVSLLVRSAADNVVDAPQRLCYPSWASACTDLAPTNLIASDRRKYEVYTTTAAIRNRLIKGI